MLSSCVDNTKLNSVDGKKIYIGKVNAVMSLSDVVDRFTIIPLETKGNSLLCEVSKVKVAGGKLFVFDEVKGTVSAFSESGDFINQIGKKGKGPGEFLTCSDYFIDNYNVIVYDSSLGKLLTYSFKGELVNEFISEKIRGYFSCCKLDDKLMGFYVSSGYSRELIIFSTEKNEKLKRVIDPQVKKDFIYEKGDYFFKTDDKVFVCPNFNDTIFMINESKVTPYYVLDYGDFKAPNNFYPVDHISYNGLRDGGYCFQISHFFDFKKTSVIQIRKGNRDISLFISKENNNVKGADRVKNDLFGFFWGGTVIGQTKTEMITCVFPQEILVNKDILLKQKNIPNKVLEIIKNLKIDDNPLLIRYELKKTF